MNPNNKPESDKRKMKTAKAAASFADMAKNTLKTPKRTVLLSLMANYGLKIRAARAIYRAA